MIPHRHGRLRTAFVVLLVTACTALPVPGRSQALPEGAALAALVRQAAKESVARTPVGFIALRVQPPQAEPLVTQVFAEEFTGFGARVTTRTEDAPVVLLVDAREMRADAGSLGKTMYFRNLSVRLGVMAEQRASGVVFWSKEFELTRTDTLDTAPPYVTRDFLAVESPSWIDTLLLPAAAAAAAIVIVVLLFTVRSS